MTCTKHLIRFGIVAAALTHATVSAHAQSTPTSDGPFSIDINIFEDDGVTVQPGGMGSFNFETAEDVIDAFDSDFLDLQFPTYTEMTIADATLNFRGLDFILAFETMGPGLEFDVPSIDIDLTFDEFSTRDANLDALETFLESEGDAILAAIFEELAAVSPVDPVAGNPNSVQGQTVATQSMIGAFDGNAAPAGTSPEANENAGLGAGISVSGGRYSAGGLNGQSATLPLQFYYQFKDPRWKITAFLPVGYFTAEGAQTVTGTAGLALQTPGPVLDRWQLTFSGAYGVAASVDLGGVGQIVSGSFSSKKSFDGPLGTTLTLGNHAGYTTTLVTEIGDFRNEADITNWVTKNGLIVEAPIPGWTIFKRPVALRFLGAYTQYFGDELFVESLVDFGATIGLASVNGKSSPFQIGVKGAFGDDYNAIQGSFGVRF